MSPASSSVVVHVPPGYPTALFFIDESAVRSSAGRVFVVGAIKVRSPRPPALGVRAA
jgi:hypothetical protein